MQVCNFEAERRSARDDQKSAISRAYPLLLRGGSDHETAEPTNQSSAKALEQQETAEVEFHLDSALVKHAKYQDLDWEDAEFAQYFALAIGHVTRLLSVYWCKAEKASIQNFWDQLLIHDADLSDDASRARICRAVLNGEFDVTTGRMLFNQFMNRIVVAVERVERAGASIEHFALCIRCQTVQELGEKFLEPDESDDMGLADRNYKTASHMLDCADRSLKVNIEKKLNGLLSEIMGVERTSPKLVDINQSQFDYIVWDKEDTPLRVQHELGSVSAMTLYAIHDGEQRNINLSLVNNEIRQNGYHLTFNDPSKKWKVTALVKWQSYETGRSL